MTKGKWLLAPLAVLALLVGMSAAAAQQLTNVTPLPGSFATEQPARVLPVTYEEPVALTAPQEAEEAKVLTLDELRAEMKKLAWTKGDFRIVPYGILWFNMAYDSHSTNNGDYVLYSYSRDLRDDGLFSVNARSTRLGINITGPDIPFFCCAHSGGKVEIDFFGAFAGTENKAGVLLRHAYWEVKNERFRLLAGQTWDVISPLNPGTLLYSVLWSGGNIGYRRAQLRYERYIPLGPATKLTLQGALACDIVSETAVAVDGGHAGWPVIQGRVALTMGQKDSFPGPLTVGVSSHVGEQRFEFDLADPTDDEMARTWSLNVDVRWPISPRFGVQGEFFTGENLGAYLGGIVQGINMTTAEEIRASGGWMEVWYDWTPRLHSHVGFGIDDPINRDVAAGGRTYNQVIFANMSYDITDKFLMGIEYSNWKTKYEGLAAGDTNRIEFVAKYSF